MSERSPVVPRTVGEALDAFLMAERLRLAESTLQRYRNVITLFRIFLENSEVQAAPGLHADVEMMAVLAEEFVNGFLANKLARGESTWRNAATVMRRLLRWLDDRLLEEYTPDDGVDKTSTEVTAAVSLHDLLAQHLGQQPPVHAVRHRRDVFIVARTEPGAMWLTSATGGDEVGPVSVPMAVSQICRVGWELNGLVARSFGGWRLLEVSSVNA
ncbi:MAG: hypothetical protein EB084_00475 [Proteobacteria bacterium]|nr:hypothetical protein [Pseudomonadota bacterium]